MKCKSANRYIDKSSGIYAIVNKLNNKIYVGSTIILQKRKSEHFLALRKNKHANRYLQFAFNKYGIKNFEFIILEIVENADKLVLREQHWINFYNCIVPNGYNLAPFAISQLGFRHSEKSKQLISKVQKGRKASAETKAKMSATRKGRKQNPEWIAKRVEASKLTKPVPKGRKPKLKKPFIVTDEYRKKMSIARRNTLEIEKLLARVVLLTGVIFPDTE